MVATAADDDHATHASSQAAGAEDHTQQQPTRGEHGGAAA